MKNPAGLHVFAHRFRLLRKARGYSQQPLTDFAHVEQATSKRLELRQLAPTLDLLISLSRALDLKVCDLVDDPAITHSDLEGPAEPLLPGRAAKAGLGAERPQRARQLAGSPRRERG